jgi:hypothetical protein
MRFLRLRGQTVVNELSIIKAYSEEKLKQGTKQGALVRVFYFYYRNACLNFGHKKPVLPGI